MAIKKGDFVTLDFTGTITETQEVFDTTKQDVAKEHGIQTSRMTYEPITVCVGEGHVLPGLDEELVGKKDKDTFTVELSAEKAFGKKQANQIKLMPKKLFDKQNIRVQPGLKVTIDNMPGTIKSVSGNRVVVDFNHQLAGKDLSYEISTQGLVTETKQQVESLVNMALHAPCTAVIKDKTATVQFPVELPKEVQEQLSEKITGLTEITEVKFENTKAKQNA